MNHRLAALPPLILLLLAGCASPLFGVGGEARYACRAPEGAQCTSVSGVYANSLHGAMARGPAPESPRLPAAPLAAAAAQQTAAEADAGLRSKPRLLRVWIAPWEDSDGDLHEAATVHLLVDSGHWLIEHVRPARNGRPDGVAPPAATAPEGAAAKPETSIPATDRLPASPAGSSGGDAGTPAH